VVTRGVLALFLFAAAAIGSDAAAHRLKGDGPTTIAAGSGSVWIGTGRGAVLRLDPTTGRVSERFTRERFPSFVSDLVASHGFLWLGDSSRPLARLDPSSGRIREVAALQSLTPGPGPVAAGAGSVWSGDWSHDRLFRIEPRTARTVRSAVVPGRIVDVAAGRAGAYIVYAPNGIAGPRLLRRVDARTAQPVGPAVRFRCDLGVAVGASSVWTVDYCTWRLARRDPRTLRVRAARRSPPLATNVLLAHGSVWVLGGPRLVRFDRRSLRVTARLWIRAAAAAATPDALWLLDIGDGQRGIVRRLEPRTNRIVAAYHIG
jgi:streptogramin lyase